MQSMVVNGATGAQFGLLTVGDNGNNEFYLNNYTTIAQLQSAVSSIPFETGQDAVNIAVSNDYLI